MKALLNVPSVTVKPADRTGRVVVLDDAVARFWDNAGHLIDRLDGVVVSEITPNREWVVTGRTPDGREAAWTVVGDCGCRH